MTWNMSAVVLDSSTGVVGLMQGVNTATSGIFGIIILLALTFVFFMAFVFVTRDAQKSILGGLALSFFLTIMMRIMGLISDMIVFIALVGYAAALAFMWKQE